MSSRHRRRPEPHRPAPCRVSTAQRASREPRSKARGIRCSRWAVASTRWLEPRKRRRPKPKEKASAILDAPRELRSLGARRRLPTASSNRRRSKACDPSTMVGRGADLEPPPGSARGRPSSACRRSPRLGSRTRRPARRMRSSGGLRRCRSRPAKAPGCRRPTLPLRDNVRRDRSEGSDRRSRSARAAPTARLARAESAFANRSRTSVDPRSRSRRTAGDWRGSGRELLRATRCPCDGPAS